MNPLKDKTIMEIKNKCFELFSSKTIFSVTPELSQKMEELFKVKCVEAVVTDNELIKTSQLFFENNLNISSTSKEGFMHRNTLIYRLDKIKKLMGLDIRNFAEAVVFENLLLMYEMNKNR